AVRWSYEIPDHQPGNCAPGTNIGAIRDCGGGIYRARLPIGVPARLLCRDGALREWESVVVARSQHEEHSVVLTRPELVRRLTLVPRGGTIESVRVTAFADSRSLYDMPLELTRHAESVSLMVPTDPCQVMVESATGEVAVLREGHGTDNATVPVLFRGTRRVKLTVVDPDGRPVPDVL